MMTCNDLSAWVRDDRNAAFAARARWADAMEALAARVSTDIADGLTPSETVAAWAASVGYETAAVVLASFVNVKSWDGRISDVARRWAESVPHALDERAALRCGLYSDRIHAAHLSQLAEAFAAYVPDADDADDDNAPAADDNGDNAQAAPASDDNAAPADSDDAVIDWGDMAVAKDGVQAQRAAAALTARVNVWPHALGVRRQDALRRARDINPGDGDALRIIAGDAHALPAAVRLAWALTSDDVRRVERVFLAVRRVDVRNRDRKPANVAPARVPAPLWYGLGPWARDDDAAAPDADPVPVF